MPLSSACCNAIGSVVPIWAGRAGSPKLPLAPPTAVLGAALKYWWQVDLAVAGNPNITVAAGLVTSLRERVTNTNMTVASGGADTITYSAVGGAGDSPFLRPTTVNSIMNQNIAVPAGNRYAWYVVCRCRSFGSVGNARIGSVAGVGVAGHVFCGTRANNADNYVVQVDFTGGTQGVNIVSPANDFGYHIHSMLPLVTGAKFQIDGFDTTPNLTGNDTVVACTGQAIGFTGVSGTDVEMIMILDTTVGNFLNNDAYIQAYSYSQFGCGRVQP